MNSCFVSEAQDRIVPIIPVCQDEFVNWLASQSHRIKNIISANKFLAKPNSYCLVIDQTGDLEQVLLGIAHKNDYLAFGILPKVLPTGSYEIVAQDFSKEQLERAAIGWGMGSYKFAQYRKPEVCADSANVTLVCKNLDLSKINRAISATFLVRDLINTPAGDMYPERLAEIAAGIAEKFQADIKIISEDRLSKEFPAIYAVGRGSNKRPLLIDLQHGEPTDPKVVLVGKGVCFDSGGLQLKSSSGMILMKKDMAGAAHALALASMIMEAKLPINLRVIIPAVENLISGDSLKPGDIIRTRKGVTLEVANTDAEGRLILSDALALASEWQPELIVDFATLTGAARIALGPDIAALFSNNDQLAQDIISIMDEEQDPVWRMPLHQPYLKLVKSEIADFKNVANDGVGGGAITAALILQQFVASEIKWIHFDINAYNASTTPGKPEGGEASCITSLFKYFERNF